ncbi:MAG TPA: phasin family protein [Candidatus Competibacteraceae bacterium]|nr:phasin family protein [Candidatus Competibacteraceae bacterium]
MINDVMSKVFEQSQSYLVPVVKTNKLVVGNLEKLVSFQMSALQGYVDMGLGQLKAAVEVSNYQDLQSFLNGQVEFLAALRQKALDDAKALADLGAGFKADFDKLAEENISELTEKAAKITKTAAPAAPAAKKAAA